jgi:hypothetical protein
MTIRVSHDRRVGGFAHCAINLGCRRLGTVRFGSDNRGHCIQG